MDKTIEIPVPLIVEILSVLNQFPRHQVDNTCKQIEIEIQKHNQRIKAAQNKQVQKTNAEKK